MKTKTLNKEKSPIEQLRTIRDKISLEIQDLNYEELKEYIEKRLNLHPKSVWKQKQK